MGYPPNPFNYWWSLGGPTTYRSSLAPPSRIMSEEKGWWEEEGSPEAEASPESESWWAARSRALEERYGTEWEPGMREFYLLLIIAYVLWWAGTGIF